jgi:hypothetical protein
LDEFSSKYESADDELHNFYSSSIIRMIKSRSMRLAGHVAQMGEKRNAYSGKTRRKETTKKTKMIVGE